VIAFNVFSLEYWLSKGDFIQLKLFKSKEILKDLVIGVLLVFKGAAHTPALEFFPLNLPPSLIKTI
jgi:hypothetical protein